MKRHGISFRAKSFFTQKIKIMVMGVGMKSITCARCRNEMQMVIQSEKIGNRVEVVYLYKCIACRRSQILEVVEIKRNTDRIIVTKIRMNVS